MTNTLKVGIYARVSTKDGRQDTTNQLAQLRDFCAKQGWAVEHEYVDNASGKTADRPQFKRMFTDASQRRFGLVLFWSLDRFSREGVRETLNHLELLGSYGVGFRSFTESYLDSCGLFKDAVLAILAVIAKQERVRLSERTLAGLSRAKSQGRVGGRPKVIFDKSRAIALSAAGQSCREVAAELGVSHSSIARLLKATA